MDAPLLNGGIKTGRSWGRVLCFVLPFFALFAVGATFSGDLDEWLSEEGRAQYSIIKEDDAVVIESQKGVVAADDARCSKIGVSVLRKGGHAVDAAVATALCVGVVNPMASGIGGGSFMVIRSSEKQEAEAYDMRETAPAAASEGMFANNPSAKYQGPLSMGVPGEIAGLHAAWLKHGKLTWTSLFEPSIKLAKEGFVVAPYLATYISQFRKMILGDPGLRQVFAPNGKLLSAGDTCYNKELGQSLELIAEQGPEVFYNGIVGEKLIKDVREAGGILTMDDLKNYKVDVSEALSSTTMGYTIYGMQPPSSGTVGLSMVMNILESYGNANAAKGNIGLHRLIEALKHMFAVRMNLGDPNFVSVNDYVSQMLSHSYAKQIRERIFDNTTFPSEYYLYKWSQLRDHGTSHFCIVDSDRNAVSMTTTVNYPFGAGVLSPATGIVLNNEMGDFSMPTEITPDMLPPAPANFIRPNKRPLSSMTPLIITKDGQLAGVIGGSGGMSIIPAVVQVFLNHFVLGMEPLSAVQNPRIYHGLIPNVVHYENLTCIDGDHIELTDDSKLYLKQRGHKLEARAGGAIVQLIAQRFDGTNPINLGRKGGRVSSNQAFKGILTAVSDPRKDGRPAAV
ncbi:hypothetical protein MLD38_014311 [Melastoma candidum]|uniref:Uncharacterized protein n=1 Tax=Melastoma candidum TaxID=119954 RepID=A0ACB9RG35_9MYRT|nr:hypothetical protein MLD38_014311 [Melastoma candidum]